MPRQAGGRCGMSTTPFTATPTPNPTLTHLHSNTHPQPNAHTPSQQHPPPTQRSRTFTATPTPNPTLTHLRVEGAREGVRAVREDATGLVNHALGAHRRWLVRRA
eukprot:363842-Chlamydomonas_euryale.AAC.7